MDDFNYSLVVTFLLGLISFILLLWYSLRKQSYWKDRGVPFVKPLPLLGSMLDYLVGEPLHEIEMKKYFSMPTIYGYFEGNRPLLTVGDPHLFKDIFVKGFSAFPNRRSLAVNDYIMDNTLPTLEGEAWKRVRSIVTPTFSTGKLKRCMSIFKDCSKTLIQNFKTFSLKKEPVDMKKTCGAYSIDVIASSAFSTKLDSHNDPENQFALAAKKVFQNISWRFAIFSFSPALMKFFKISLFNPVACKFFWDLTSQIMEERKRTKQTRNDFLQLLMDTAEKTEDKDVDNDEDLTINYEQEAFNKDIFKNTANKSISKNEMISQCISFFLAGYDTTGSSLAFATYSLAMEQDVQDKARQEISKCLKDTKGDLTYEALQGMKYLDNVVSETLRLYPPAIRTERRAEFDYKLGDTGITIEKGIHINIPIYSLHHDPKFYLNPEKFDPNRFSEEERAKRDPYVFLPFGAGPRNCIGMRFALLEIKICLVYIISCFKIKTCPQTQIPMQFYKGFGLLAPKPILLMLEPIEDCSLNLQ